MKQWSITILVKVLFFIIITPWSVFSRPCEIDPKLAQIRRTSELDEQIPIVVFFYDPISGSDLLLEVEGLNHVECRAYVIERVSLHLEETAASVIAWFEEEASQGHAELIRPLWIVNAYALWLENERIDELEAFPEVERIRYEYFVTLEDLIGEENITALHDSSLDEAERLEWGVEDIGAPVLWEQGYHGEGIIVASMDTGCLITHRDLMNHIWLNEDEIPNNGIDDDENGYVDDIHGWNFVSQNNNLSDVDGHGTSCAGILVGDGSRGDTTGIAPGAKLMVLRIFDNHNSEARNWEAMQYAIVNGARVVSNSLSYKYSSIGDSVDLGYPDWATHRRAHEIALAAGMIQSNSTGNTGDGVTPWNISAPANCPPPWLHPQQTLRGGLTDILGCGAYNNNGSIYSRSDRGPSEWFRADFPEIYRDYPWLEGAMLGLLKPDVVAPCQVYSTSSSGGYGTFSATSSATPHLGGALTLLRSIHPQATPANIAEAVLMSAEDGGLEGHDREFGAGYLRVDLAHEYLEDMFDYGSLHLSIIIADAEDDENYKLSLNGGELIGYSNPDDPLMIFIPHIIPGEYLADLFCNEELIGTYEQVVILPNETTELTWDTSVSEQHKSDFPIRFTLSDPYPNPFNSAIRLQFSLPSTAEIKLAVFSIDGREVVSLMHGLKPAGNHEILWRPENLASGVYLAALYTPKGARVKKIVLLR